MKSPAFLLVLVVSIMVVTVGYSPVDAQTASSDVTAAGVQANRFSTAPYISADGGNVVFTSAASNLVPGDNNIDWDAFIRNIKTGQTTLVSVSTTNIQANAGSGGWGISADNRYVVFSSDASNLVFLDTNGFRDIFVRDLQTKQTSRVSVSTANTQANGKSEYAAISANGRYVAFTSEASNLVPLDTNGTTDVFVRDLQTGTTTRVSISSLGEEIGGGNGRLAISADGRYVVFIGPSYSYYQAPELYSCQSYSSCILLHDQQTHETTYVAGDGFDPSMSADGRYVVYSSPITWLNGLVDIPGDEVYIYDQQIGESRLISVYQRHNTNPRISANGLYVTYTSWNASISSIYLYDLQKRQTTLVSVNSSGIAANNKSFLPSISANGRYIAFESDASNLVFADTNGFRDIFIRDRITGQTTMQSIGSSAPSLSITSVTLQHQILPERSWQPLPSTGTTDGNIVLVSIKVFNSGGSSGQAKVRLVETTSGNVVAEGSIATGIEPHKDQTISLFWDTNGYAWNPGAEANLGRQLRVELWSADGNTLLQSQVQPSVIIKPKPVILVHGIRSTACMWMDYKNWLRGVNNRWIGFAVGDGVGGTTYMDMGLPQDECNRKSNIGITKSLDQNAFILNQYIEEIRNREDALHVDLVAHSMGGLVSRNYIAQFMPVELVRGTYKPVVSHLVMLGTPNEGAFCANIAFIDPFVYRPTLDELTGLRMAFFNFFVRNVPHTYRYVPFYLVAGNSSRLPCTIFPFNGDGVVTFSSATAISSDIEVIAPVDASHSELTSSVFFNQYVKNWLAVPPPSAGAMTAPAQSMPIPAEISAQAETPPPQIIISQQPTIAGGATLNIPLLVPAASRLQIVLIAPPTVAASLLNPSGAVIDQYAANSSMAQLPFQGLVADNPTPGTWTLRLVNTGTTSATMLVSASVEGSALLLDLTLGTPDSQRRVQINAALSNSGAPVTGATVSATLSTINGTSEGTLTLLDDGLNGDGAAGDGAYGRLSAPLPVGVHSVSVTASGTGFTRSTGGQVEVTGFDLSLLATAAPDPVFPGTSLTYTLTITNSGPSDAGNVVVTDTLPTGVTFVAAESTWGNICSELAGVVTCNVGTVFAATNGTIQISVIPLSPKVLTNQADLTSSDGDTNLANNSVSTNTTVSNAPPSSAPVLLDPIGGSIINDSTPLLVWQAADNATDYQIEIDTDPTFGSPDQTLTSATLNIETAELVEGAFVWRARATNSAGEGTWSATGSFSVDTVPPGIPFPTAPADLLNTVLPVPVFTWGSASDAVRYEVQLDTVNPPVVTVYSGTELTFTPPTPLPTNTYYWRVWAVDAAGNLSVDGQIRSFTLTNSDNRAPDLNFFNTSVVPLNWARISDAQFYQIEVDNTATFTSTLEFSQTVSRDLLTINTVPLLNGVYWWRVRACSSPTTCSAWSGVQTFTIGA